ncbi:MAG: hypothetical protein QNJ38_03990 [Prochloraceae cyanobacterium]|nr:hypothetical protein [Prochloraceae cyanobacterium]
MAMTQEQHQSPQSSETDSPDAIELTPRVQAFFNRTASETGLSRLKLLENIAKGELAIASNAAKKTIVLETSLEDGNPEKSINLVSFEDSPEQQEIAKLKNDLKKYQSLKAISEQQAALISELASKLKEQSQSEHTSIQQAQRIKELEQLLQQEQTKLAEQAQKYHDMEHKSIAKDTRITRLQEQLKEHQIQTAEKEKETSESLQQQSTQQSLFIKRLQKNLQQQIDKNKTLEQEFQAQKMLIQELTSEQNQDLDRVNYATVKKLEQEARLKDLQIKKLAEDLSEQSRLINFTKKAIERIKIEKKERDLRLQQQLQAKDLHIKELEGMVAKYQAIYQESESIDTGIKELQKQLLAERKKYNTLERDCQEKETRINELELELDLREEDNTDLQQKIDAQEFAVSETNEAYQSLVEELKSKNEIVQELERQIQAAPSVSVGGSNSNYEALQQESLDKDVQIIRLQEELEKQKPNKKLQIFLISITSVSLLGLLAALSFGYYYYSNHY